MWYDLPSLKLTYIAPENGGPPGSLEILNLETIIFRGEQLVLGSVSIQLMIRKSSIKKNIFS